MGPSQQTLPGIPASADLHLLAGQFDRACFFDIETSSEGPISLIAALRGAELFTFVRGENLDDFLEFLDGVPLLVSFNGKLFDVPQVLEQFHVPELPCAHLDLRPVCKAHGLTGGLKAIEKRLGVRRPHDVAGLDGEDAMWLWRAWERDHDESARRRLIRYCRSDVVGLREIAAHLLDEHVRAFVEPPVSLWHLVEEEAAPPVVAHAVRSENTCDDPLYRRLRRRTRSV